MSNKEQVQVIIDSNEEAQNQELTSLFVLHEDVEKFNIETLEQKEGAETGDFIIEDCIFERKTPSDFAGSLTDGHLRDQIDRMLKSEYRPFILVEGDMSDFSNLEHTQMPSKSLRGMTASIIGRYDIPVVFCSEGKYLADIAIRIARKTVEDPSQIQVSNSDIVKEVPFIVKFFMNFDGIGLETAEKLADSFESVESTLNADINQFQQVDGVGDVTAKEIYSTLHNKDIDDSGKEEDNDGVTMVRI